MRVFWSGEGPCRALRDHHLQKMGVAGNNDQSLSFLSLNRLSYEPSRFMGSILIPQFHTFDLGQDIAKKFTAAASTVPGHDDVRRSGAPSTGVM